MTPREPEPSDFDRPLPSARPDRRDRDRDDRPGHDAGDEPTTGHHRIPDDLRDYDGLARTGRADGTPPAPRRRRGTPPTHGLPVPPPPITKEFVSDDAPRPVGDRPANDRADSRPIGPVDPVDSAGAAPVPGSPVPGPRHSDPDDGTDRRSETGRHGAATSSHRAPDAPAERSGRFAGFRVPRTSDTSAGGADSDPGQPVRDGRHDRRSRGDAPAAGGGRAVGASPSGDIDSDTSSTGQTGATPDLRGFGGLRAGVARLGGARVGDALRQRGAAPVGGGPRRRFGGTGEQPTIEPNGRGDGAPNASPDGAGGQARSDAEKSGRDRRVFGARRGSTPAAPTAGPPTAGPVSGAPTRDGRRDRIDRRRSEPGDSGQRAVSEPTSQLPTVGQASPADRTTGAVRAVGPNGVPGGGPNGVPGGGPTGARATGGGPTGSRSPGGGPTGARMPGGGPTGTRAPGGGPTGTGMPSGGSPGPAGSTLNGAARPGGRMTGPVGPGGRPGPGNPARGGGPTGPIPPMPGQPGAVAPGGGPSRPIGRGPSGSPQRGGASPAMPGGGPSGPLMPGGGPSGPVMPGGGATGPVMPGGGPSSAGPGGRPAQAAGVSVVRPGPMGPTDTQAPGSPGRVIAAMPTPAVSTPSMPPPPMPMMAGPMPTQAIPITPGESRSPIGVPPSAFSDTAIVAVPPVGRGIATPAERDSVGVRETRFANQVHFPTTRAMIIAMLSVVVALIGILPAALVLTESSGNPDFAAIDRLDVPSWAGAHPVDHTSGNRWCLSACLKSERTVTSTHTVTETAGAYATALRAAGWTSAPANACPPVVKGATQSCWVLDRYQLNVMVTTSACAGPPAPATEPGLIDPATPSTPASPPAGCAPTAVDISVFDRIDLRPATQTRG